MTTSSDFPADDGTTPDAAATAAAKADRLQMFGSTLAGTRDKWIRARAATGWDKRVAVDIDQYHSKDAANKTAANMMESVEQGYPVTSEGVRPHRSTVFVGISRQKTNAAEARLSDILLPTDDRNWGIQPTPDPECAAALQMNGTLEDPLTGKPILVDISGNVVPEGTQGAEPLTKKKVAQAAQWIAHKAAQAMQMEIDDQLSECDYNAEVRKMLHTAAVMGTGVLKGPVVTKRVRKAWREKTETDPTTGQPSSIQVMEVIEELSPASFDVDPRMVWEDPACGDDVHNGAGIFEMSQKTPRQVKELGQQPGYILDQLRAVIEEGPQRSAALTETRQQIDDHNQEAEKTFQHWIYWGELDRTDLEAAGVVLDNEDDPLVSYCGCIEMINNKVVRAYLNPLEDSPIPYDFYSWEKVQGSPRGYGVPYLMRPQQSVTNAAWRQLMDNSGITAGPQIVMRRGGITPADGSYAITPMKFWFADDENVDVSKAFASFEFASHQPELQAIIELAEKLGDQETATPMMAQGQQGSAPDTVGGMQMLMNSANVVLRRLVKQFDDYVTKPHIKRYYDYNMLYSEKDEVKGDFSIDARGSSALVIRDIQNQAFTNLMQVAGNPIFAPMINPRELFTKALQAQHIDPADIMYTEDEVAANAAKNPPQPPIPLQVAMIKAKAQQTAAQAVEQGKEAEVQQRMESEVEDRKLRVLELQITRDIAVMQAASTEKVSVAQINADLAQATLADRTRKEIEAANITLAENTPQHHGVGSVAPQPPVNR